MENGLQNLKVDDLVIVTNRFGQSVAKVSRITKAQIIIKRINCVDKEYEQKYRIDNGDIVGRGTWDCDSISVPKEGEVETVRRNNKLKRMRIYVAAIEWDKISDENIEKAFNILSELGIITKK